MRVRLHAVLWAAACSAALTATAAVVPQGIGRFDALLIQDPASRIPTVAETPDQVLGYEAGRAGWAAFRAESGGAWRVWIDRRSGAPLLAQGDAVRWVSAGQIATAGGLETAARRFVGSHESLFGVRTSELSLNVDGTASTDPDHWVVVFDRVVQGIPVEGEHFVLYVNRGSLVSFGADRWGAIDAVAAPALDAPSAYALLRAYMGLGSADTVEMVESGHLVLAARPADGTAGAAFAGSVGAGIVHDLAWRFSVRVDGEPGTWVGKIDARSGRILAFYDDDQYSQVKGGIYPSSNDQNCSDLGCEKAGYAMPYANVTIAKKATATDDYGNFVCGKGSKNSSVALSGPYIMVVDQCGGSPISGNCTGDLDFGTSTGTDCTSPSGLSGDTHAARTDYFHLNRAKEKARYWLPSNTWVNQQLQAKPNITSTCNAYYNGNVNFYRSGGGCRNTGEIAGVVCHEYGHGLDANDGGGSENPGEAYADVIAMLEERRSCIGRGFYQSGACSGYGDACLSCSGIRDTDYAQHVSNTPATPANFIASHCGGGGGPCGGEVHCESYVATEAIFDLATRDLPATGLDADSSWQLAEKLYYKSRQGSGGNAYNCALPSSDGCGASAWFTKLLAADDDDGNLGNGTPHAAAIFAAFNRHAIACGSASDPGNQNSGTCATLTATTVTATPGTDQVSLSWATVPGASRYLVLRNDIACASSSNVIATVSAPTTTYTDTNLPTGFQVYYKVQAQAANVACDGLVSACVPATAN